MKKIFLSIIVALGVMTSCQKQNIDTAEILNQARLLMTEGNGVEQNHKEATRLLEKAVKWYTKSAAQGFAAGQYCLGMCYLNGNGVEQDIKKAKLLIGKAANQGYAEAEEVLKTL